MESLLCGAVASNMTGIRLHTITFDLTQAILSGVFLSGLVYLSQSASIDIAVQEVDPEKLRQRGLSELIGEQNIFWRAD